MLIEKINSSNNTKVYETNERMKERTRQGTYAHSLDDNTE